MKAILVTFAMLFTVSAADAAIHAGISTFINNSETEGPTLGENETSTTYLDFKLGYLMANDLYVGAVHSSATSEVNNSETKRTLLGATLGYHSRGGFFIDGTYYFKGDYEFPGGSKLTDGSGIAIELGFNQSINTNFYVGVELAYKSITYKKVEVSGSEVAQTNKEKSEMYPMLNLGFLF